MLIKTVARQNWPAPPGEHSTAEGHEYTTWYEPWDDQRTITAAVSWALSLPGVTGLATPGDVRLLGMVVEAERSPHRRRPTARPRSVPSRRTAHRSSTCRSEKIYQPLARRVR